MEIDQIYYLYNACFNASRNLLLSFEISTSERSNNSFKCSRIDILRSRQSDLLFILQTLIALEISHDALDADREDFHNREISHAIENVEPKEATGGCHFHIFATIND
jgi:hypothetical protein